MAMIKLQPGFKDYIWGGSRLIGEYHKKYDGEILAESWELSCNRDCPSSVSCGDEKGMTLEDYIKKYGFIETLGENCRRFEDFPILTKFIDARKALSIQVHPDEEYASRVEHQHGKTEMWYIVDAEPGASIYYGFENEISREEFMKRINDNTLPEVLHKEEVHRGDVFFIEAGTLHALGAGVLVAEIQQNSDVTYRIYDYGRIGRDGKPRELHVEKALDVTKRIRSDAQKDYYPHIGSCDYFTVDHLILDGARISEVHGNVNGDSFLHVLVTKGSGEIQNHGTKMSFSSGDSIFFPAGSGDYTIHGAADILLTYEV